MRKTMSRLFMAVLMVALLVGASIISVSAANEGPTCDGNHEGWNEITGATMSITEAGNYYVKDADVATNITIDTAAGAAVKICLHGHDINATGIALHISGAAVDLVNCGETANTITTSGKWTAIAAKSNTTACTLNIGKNVVLDNKNTAGKTLSVQVSSTVNLYDGAKISKSVEATINGPTVYLSSGTVNMYGGTITGTTTGNGGGVYMAGGTFNMKGGTIDGCSANMGVGVYVNAGTFNMEGGTISNCKVSDGQSGGGVYVAAGTFNMKDGTITGCSGKYGGGVRNNATFNMTGGTIGGNITTDGGNGSEVYANGTTNIHGGTINGTTTTTTIHVTITKDGTKTTMDGGNLVGGLWAASTATYEITGGKFTETPAKYVDQTNYRVLSLTDDADGYLFEVVKYGDHDTHENWIEISASKTISAPGKYVLTNNVTGYINVSEGVTGVVVCMNGHSIARENGNAVTSNKGTELTLCNCSETTVSTITATDTQESSTDRRAIYVYGTVTVGKGVKITGCNDKDAVFVYIDTAGTYGKGHFILDGGEISGNTVTGSIVNINQGIVEIKSGEIKDNTQGRSLINGSGEVIVSGGTITTTMSGTSFGSAIHTSAGATISGGTISGNGNAVYCSGNTMNINGAANITGHVVSGAATSNVILGGKAYVKGNVSVYGAATIEGGTITGNVTVNQRTNSNKEVTGYGEATISGGGIGGKVSAAEGTTLTINGGKFSNKTARDTLAEYAGTKVVAEIEDGAYSYKVQDAGFYSLDGEYMDFHSALGLGLYLNASAENYTVSAGKYSCTSTKHGDLDVILASGIAAKDMDEAITFEVKDGDTVLFRKTMSIYEAAKTWNADANKQTMVADMINYGNEAKKVFVDDYVLMDTTDLTGATEDAPTWTGVEGAGVSSEDGDYSSLVAATLNLKDQIELNIYVNDKDATAENSAAERTTLTNAKGDTITRFTFKNIPVNAVKSTEISLNITLADGTTQFTVKYSIADYVKQALSEQNNQQALLIALQKYVDSVTSYQSN